jgi:hypothetical protein
MATPSNSGLNADTTVDPTAEPPNPIMGWDDFVESVGPSVAEETPELPDTETGKTLKVKAKVRAKDDAALTSKGGEVVSRAQAQVEERSSRRIPKAKLLDLSIGGCLANLNPCLVDLALVHNKPELTTELKALLFSQFPAIRSASFSRCIDSTVSLGNGTMLRSFALVQSDRKVVAAMVLAYRSFTRVLEVVLLTTSIDFRKKGFARLLLCAAADIGVSLGCVAIIVDGTSTSEGFWGQTHLMGLDLQLEPLRKSSFRVPPNDLFGVMFKNVHFMLHVLSCGATHSYTKHAVEAMRRRVQRNGNFATAQLSTNQRKNPIKGGKQRKQQMMRQKKRAKEDAYVSALVEMERKQVARNGKKEACSAHTPLEHARSCPRQPRPRPASGLFGVRAVKKRWIATIGYDGKTHHLGTFDTKQEAAVTYDRAARQHGQGQRELNYGSIEEGEKAAAEAVAENGRTCPPQAKSRAASGFFGVCANRQVSGTRWIAHISYDGKTHYLGTFDTTQEAALMYDRAARQHGQGQRELNYGSIEEGEKAAAEAAA